jgi:alpha-tubulin suppressor-like RCC1 family protein
LLFAPSPSVSVPRELDFGPDMITVNMVMARVWALIFPIMLGFSTWCLSAPPPGIVIAWGNNGYDQLNIPANLTNAIAVAGNVDATLTLQSDGTVLAWGRYESTNVPPGLSNVIAIAGNWDHSLALKNDGVVVTWPLANFGLNSVPPGATNVIQIAAGRYHSLALRADGHVFAWGAGQTTSGYYEYGQSIVPADLTNAVAIAAGDAHSLALRSNGTVVAWGRNTDYWGYYRGQISVPPGLSNLIAIAANGDHSLALKSDGTVVAWGDNQYSQSSVPAGLSSVVEIAAGDLHSVALKADGTVACWGANGYTNVPAGLTNVAAIGAGNYHTLAINNGAPALLQLSSDQSVYSGTSVTFSVQAAGRAPLAYQWRFNAADIPTGRAASVVLSNVQPADSGSYTVIVTNAQGTVTSTAITLTVNLSAPNLFKQPTNQIALIGWNPAFAVTAGGSLPLIYQWQFNGTDIVSETGPSLMLSNVQPAASGAYRVLVSNSQGTNATTNALLTVVPTRVVAWGTSYYGQTVVPVGLTNVIGLANSDYFVLALRADGTVVGWGTGSPTNIPAALHGVIALSAGSFHALALLSDGSVVGWGNNSYGQIASPAMLSNAVAIAAGAYFSVGLRNDGQVFVWGRNSFAATNVPAGLSNVVAIAANGFHTLALRRDGTLAAWGSYVLNDATIVLPFTAPSDLTNIVAIATGPDRSLAVRTDGTVAAWAYTNSPTLTNVPSGLSNVTAVAANGSDLALKADTTVAAWGSAPGSNAPVWLTNVIAIAAADTYGLALLDWRKPVLRASEPAWNNGVFAVYALTLSGKTYSLETKHHLGDSNWLGKPLVPGTGGTTLFNDTSATNTETYYRLRHW